MKKLLLLLLILPLFLSSQVVTNLVYSKGYRFQNGLFIVDTTKFRPSNGKATNQTYECWLSGRPLNSVSTGVFGSYSLYGSSYYGFGMVLNLYSTYSAARTYYGDSLRASKSLTVPNSDFQIHHYAFVINGDSIIQYLDGVSQNRSKTTAVRDTTATKYYIGILRYPTASYVYHSYLYSVRFYSSSLSDANILQNYQAGYTDTIGIIHTSLQFCYIIRDENISLNHDTFYDQSGNGYNAWRQSGTILDSLAWDPWHIQGEH